MSVVRRFYTITLSVSLFPWLHSVGLSIAPVLNILCEWTRDIFWRPSRGSHLCRTCVRDLEKLRQNIQKEENTLRKLGRRAGEAKGLSIILYTNETP